MKKNCYIYFSPGEVSKGVFDGLFAEGVGDLVFSTDPNTILHQEEPFLPDIVILDGYWFLALGYGVLRNWIVRVKQSYHSHGVEVIVVMRQENKRAREEVADLEGVKVVCETTDPKLTSAVLMAIGGMI